MRSIARVALIAFAMSLVPAAAFAEEKANYSEQKAGSDTVVNFTDDPLAGTPMSDHSALIKLRPGAARQSLMRPRLNFVAELAHSVENM